MWGYVVAPIASIQASLYLLVLCVNSIVGVHRGLAKTPGEFPMWGMLEGIHRHCELVASREHQP
jgi:hypothetical protein